MHRVSLPVFSRVASLSVIMMGCIAILGWLFDIALLKSVLPGRVTMKANTAISFVLGETLLRLWHQG